MAGERALTAMRALYDELPSIQCKGLCANSCGPVDMTDVERDRLTDLGVTIKVFTAEDAQAWANGVRLDCPALGPMHKHPLADIRMAKCTVYEDRPLICRLWGLSESMLCPNGCRPERVLSDEECYEFIFRAMEIGGHRYLANVETMRAQRRMFADDPEIGPLLARFIRGDRSVENRIIELSAERQRAQE